MKPRRASINDLVLLKDGLRQLFYHHYILTGDEKYNILENIDDEYISAIIKSDTIYILGGGFIRGTKYTILDIWIPLEERNKGLGTVLVKKFLRGKEGVKVKIDPRNLLAISFWKKFASINVIY